METLIVFIVSAMLHTATMLEVGELQDRVTALEKPVKTESSIVISGEPIESNFKELYKLYDKEML